MDRMVFKPETVFLMIIFAIGIILPLIILKTGGAYVNECIALTTFCVLSLFPFLLEVNATLKEIGIENLGEEADEAVDERHESTAVKRIKELRELGVWAANNKRENATKNAVWEIGEAGTEAVTKKMLAVAHNSTLYLKEIGSEAADKEMKHAASEAISKLTDVVIEIRNTITEEEWKKEARWTSIATNCREGFEEIGKKVIEKRWIVTKNVLTGLRIFYKNIPGDGVYGWTDSGRSLCILGAFITRYFKEEINHAIEVLGEVDGIIERRVLLEGFKNAEKYMERDHPDLIDHFREFRRRYEKRTA